MAYKVAAASSDGKVINQHFGRSRQFLIFNIEDNGEYSFQELRESVPPCGFGEHSDDALQKTVELLSDCRVVLISQIGPGAEQALNTKGIRAFSISDHIDHAITKLIEFEKRKSPD